ncbi:MAG: hypothetical protein ABIH27_05355 [Candidatus Omnitrophota bacterium]
MLKVYEALLNLDKRYLSAREIARILNISSGNRKVSISRLTKRKILRRLRRNLYEVSLKPTDILEAANSVYQPSYLSFTYCLGKLGLLNQIAYEIEFATPKKTKRIEIRGRGVIFRKIKKELFFGYELNDNIFTAKPEKALLDTLYLKTKGLAVINEKELNLKDINKQKIITMSRKFPLKVQQETKKLISKYVK